MTPSDTPGFPVTLDTAGSYVLTSNLVVPDANTTAIITAGISLSANFLSIDLNRFQIVGPAVCGGPDTTCNISGSGNGVDIGLGSYTLAIRNGHIVGMGFSCSCRAIRSSQPDSLR